VGRPGAPVGPSQTGPYAVWPVGRMPPWRDGPRSCASCGAPRHLAGASSVRRATSCLSFQEPDEAAQSEPTDQDGCLLVGASKRPFGEKPSSRHAQLAMHVGNAAAMQRRFPLKFARHTEAIPAARLGYPAQSPPLPVLGASGDAVFPTAHACPGERSCARAPAGPGTGECCLDDGIDIQAKLAPG